MLRPTTAPSFWFALLALVASLFVDAPASAAPDARVEKEANELRKKAIDEDLLGLSYTAAMEKIQMAIAKCGTDKCGNTLRAQLLQDLGVMQHFNKEKDKALQSFVDALKLDATLPVYKDFHSAEVDELWETAKKKSGAVATPDGPPTGDYEHTAPTEQQANTPLPVYVKYKGKEKLTKVVVRYKGQQMGALESADLTKMGEGWGGLIPCKDVTAGTLQYYVRGENEGGDQVTLGGPNAMFKVTIKSEAVGSPPSLPGATPPKQCACPPDAPPDFPGCKKKDETSTPETPRKAEGEDCEEDTECKSGTCKMKQCTAGEEAPKSKFRRLWIGGTVGIDFAFLSSADDVCKLTNTTAPVNSAGYYCTNSDGTNYPNRTDRRENDGIQIGKSDQVKGGIAPANIRLMLTADFAFNPNIMLGVRLGFVLGTFPGTAANTDGKTLGVPIHGELRGTYLIGKDALMKPGITPYVFAGGGVSEFDAKVDVTVVEVGKPGSRTVQAWGIGGAAFVALGVGGRYALSPRAALLGAAKFTAAFGGNPFMPLISPELGIQFGF